MRTTAGTQYPVYRSTSGETNRDVFGSAVPTGAARWWRVSRRRLRWTWRIEHGPGSDGR